MDEQIERQPADTVEIAIAFGRAPQQRRSRRTMERIVLAAETLFGANGYEHTSVAEIVARARSSVGAFYSRFKDKEGLFFHLHARQCHLLIERIDALADEKRWRDATLAEMIAGIVSGQFAFVQERRAMSRVFIQRSATDPAFHERYARAWGEVADKLRALLMTRRHEMRHPDPGRAVDMVLELLHSIWANDVLHHDAADITGRFDLKTREREVIATFVAYLGADPGADVRQRPDR